MSGPKLIEMRRRAREARLQKHRDLCDQLDAEYKRLAGEHAKLSARLVELGVDPGRPLEDPVEVAAEFRALLRGGQDEVAGRRYPHIVAFARAAVEEAKLTLGGRLIELHKRLKEARLSAAQLDADLAILRARSDRQTASELDALVVPGSEAVAEDDLEGLARLEQAIRKAHEGVAAFRARESARTQEGLAKGGALRGKLLSDLVSKERRAPVTSTGAPFRAKLAGLLRQAATLGDPSLWADLGRREREMEQIARSDPADTRLEVLLEAAAETVRKAERLAAFRADLRQLIDRGAMFQSGEVREVVGELEQLSAAGEVVELEPWRKRLLASLEQADRRREHEARRQAILESLRELGYEAREGMQTALVRGGRLLLQKPGQDEYAVEFVADAGLDKIQTAMVRFAGEEQMSEQQRLRDREEEERWCGEHGHLRRKLEERGWDSALLMQRPAGEHPVRVVLDASRRAPTRAGKNPSARKRSQDG